MTWLDWLLLGICIVLLWAIVSNLLINWRWFSSLQLSITAGRTTTPEPGSDPLPSEPASDTAHDSVIADQGTIIEDEAADTLVIPDQDKVDPTGKGEISSVALDPMELYKYVASIKGNRFHTCDCSAVIKIQEPNRQYFEERAEALSAGYIPCGVCNP